MTPTTRAKPHIHFHDGFWWITPWRGASYGIADPSLMGAWYRWKRDPWLPAAAKKGRP